MLCDSSRCTACAACISACPKGCIHFAADEHGYTQPVVDTSACVSCGLCEKACPVMHPPQKEGAVYPKVYCAKTKDQDLLRRSTSGGVASEITKFFIEKRNGYACGVQNGEDWVPRLVLFDGKSDYSSVSGSRYVHSRADGIYPQVKDRLEQGFDVFFCGLPCQVAALYAYLGKSYDRLFTADIVCHGCSEEKVYESYVEYVQKQKGERIVRIDHTSKDRGWSILIQRLLRIEFADGDVQYRWSQQDPYLSLFLDGAIFKPACYACPFARFPRTGDLTLGDFFGIGSIKIIKRLDPNGVSMVMVNTEKGEKMMQALAARLWTEERDIREAVYWNLNLWRPSVKSSLHDDLERTMQDPDWEKIAETYYGADAEKKKRAIRKGIKRMLGDRNTARLMLLAYKMNGTTAKADAALRALHDAVDHNVEPHSK